MRGVRRVVRIGRLEKGAKWRKDGKPKKNERIAVSEEKRKRVRGSEREG